MISYSYQDLDTSLLEEVKMVLIAKSPHIFEPETEKSKLME